MTPEELLAERPRLHIHPATNEPESWSLSDETFKLLGELVGPGSRTMETGAGMSSVFLALTGARHTAIAPDESLFARIRSYCKEKQIDLTAVEFVAQPSEIFLPRAELPELDLFIIDGLHSFPTPGIDYYYSAGALKLGGHMVIDDTQLLSCRILADYLGHDPNWKTVMEFDKTTIFMKVGSAVHGVGHGTQQLERSWRSILAGNGDELLNAPQWVRLLNPKT